MDITTQDVAALRAHPDFRATVETYAANNLASYRARPLIERWMVSDIGRASLSGTVSILDAHSRLTPAALMGSKPVTGGEVSRGRVRAYLQRAIANELILAPLAILGVIAGVWLVRRISMKRFYQLTYWLVFLLALKIIYDGAMGVFFSGAAA